MSKFRSLADVAGRTRNTWRLPNLVLACAAIVVASMPAGVCASTVYEFTGLYFPAVSIGDATPPADSYTTSMRVTGSFTVAAPLAANLPYQDIGSSLLSFAFTDGRGTLNETNSTLPYPNLQFSVGTDGSGAINEWYIYVRDFYYFSTPTSVGAQQHRIILYSYNKSPGHAYSTYAEIAECTSINSFNYCLSSNFDYATTAFPPSGGGSWATSSPNTVPLPAALPLFASGLGALGLIGWRRKRKKARATA
jgi:hypothetical protein